MKFHSSHSWKLSAAHRTFVSCILYMFIVLLMASCSDYTDDSIRKMEKIKAVGNEDPEKALVMLDSMEIGIRQESEYAKYKYDLLRVRLNDKADNMPSSDIMIKRLMEYFMENGSIQEKQEVFFYAGSIYRDLQDTPRALECFFKSLDYATGHQEYDPIMLQNTYSNLCYLYFLVQDYADALKMANKELESCRRTQANDVLPYMHLGTAYLALDSAKQAEGAFDSAYARIVQSGDFSQYQETLVYLLYDYSYFNITEKAKECMTRIACNPLEEPGSGSCMSFAWYYEALGKNDSAAIYCKRVLDDGTNVNNMYEAAKHLYQIYSAAGDTQKASQYAKIYMQLSDSMDFGKRQELAATINNQYQYHLDQKKEQDLKDEKEEYRNILILVSLVAIMLICIGYIFYVLRRNRHLKQIVMLSEELQRVSCDDKKLRDVLKEKENELDKSKESLDKTSDELNNVKQELSRVNEELTEYNKALREKERQLTEKIEQNRTFIKLLHQSELEGKADDVINAVKQSSKGKKDMTVAEWKQLYHAIDEIYPSFKDRMIKELGTFTEQQIQLCYLMRIGLSKQQIKNMTNLSRVTVWRWVKKYEWILSEN